MYSSVKRIFCSAATFSIIAIASLEATPVTVKELGVGANELITYYSNPSPSPMGFTTAYTGVIKLLVNGVATDSFCIDPFQASLSGTVSYDTAALTDAPKPYGPMGDATAHKIEQLWAKYYSPAISNQDAAGLQIAIWELVDSSVSSAFFILWGFNDYGASDFINWVDAHPSAEAADLTALVNTTGQDYLVKRVADGGASVALLGFCFLGLAAIRRKFRVS